MSSSAKDRGDQIKSYAQITKKLNSLHKLLRRAEANQAQARGLTDEGSWKRRCNLLTIQIEMLEWVLKP